MRRESTQRHMGVRGDSEPGNAIDTYWPCTKGYQKTTELATGRGSSRYGDPSDGFRATRDGTRIVTQSAALLILDTSSVFSTDKHSVPAKIAEAALCILCGESAFGVAHFRSRERASRFDSIANRTQSTQTSNIYRQIFVFAASFIISLSTIGR
ncbi:uncharacterized protein BDR25DRAFT_363764 [Lindgomyces ingoldianus]|uniref:Uncharacterized protein n=1 Tax=Lindgomyces ingoldianus TaxID=673940 RepID=A0ACB6Q919_9PLEO|nr:uncharacterized protein BDR25DRAFT_363764 [Lindgomyces ingoldianus]KAF2462651.1 hypothetical protein BDR25DRAFT_363764 [Lindgomyces ingoldianus]